MRFELPAPLTLCLEEVIPIRWGDMDVNGHVNNTIYFRYMETIRMHWFESLGLDPSPSPQSQGVVMMNAFCNFLRPLHYPGDLLARQFVGEVGSSSFDTFATLERLDQPGAPCATGGATIVWCDFQTGRSAPLPESLRRALAGKSANA